MSSENTLLVQGLNNWKLQENLKDLDWGIFSFSIFDCIKIEAQKCLVSYVGDTRSKFP